MSDLKHEDLKTIAREMAIIMSDKNKEETPYKNILDWATKVGIALILYILIPLQNEVSDLADEFTVAKTERNYINNAVEAMKTFMQSAYTQDDHKVNIVPIQNSIQLNSQNIKVNAENILDNYRAIDQLQSEVQELKLKNNK